MAIKSIHIETDVDIFDWPPLQPLPNPVPNPIPVPSPSSGKYVMLNCINWGANPLMNLPDASEHTYFVLLVNADGSLVTKSEAQERKFIADVHAKRGKATLSIAGGTQNISNITKAVTEKIGLINAIAARMAWGYDGVTLDIENTNIPSSVVNAFIIDLRARLGQFAIIGVYPQPFQIGPDNGDLA